MKEGGNQNKTDELWENNRDKRGKNMTWQWQGMKRRNK
jgi:hypothetical protein